MNLEKMTKLIENIVENEFQHIQKYKERNFTDTNKEQIELEEKSKEVLEKLREGMSAEYKLLLEEYWAALFSETISYCRFYFKEGVRVGLTDINFLNDINAGVVLQGVRLLVKIQIKYENEKDKLRIIELLSKGTKVKDISVPKKTGKFTRVYVEIE